MARDFKKTIAAFAAALLLNAAPILVPIARADEDAARLIISKQLEAFLADDFVQAYSYASQDIKRIFPTLDRFMSMVRSGYLPVLSPGNYAFGTSETQADGRVRQELAITAPDGSDWTATYYVEQQSDGTWKIDAVILNRGAAGMT